MFIQNIISPKIFYGYYYKTRITINNLETKKTKRIIPDIKFKNKDDVFKYWKKIEKNEIDGNWYYYKIIKTKEKIFT